MLRKSREGGKEFDLSNAETDIPEETGSDHGHNFVDKEDEQNFAEEAPPAARRDESGPITLFGTATASRRGPTGGLGAAAPVRAASGARAPATTCRHGSCDGAFTHTHTRARQRDP